jgi:hypothetical protein
MYCKWQPIFGDVAKDIISFARLTTTMCSLDAPNFLKQEICCVGVMYSGE